MRIIQLIVLAIFLFSSCQEKQSDILAQLHQKSSTLHAKVLKSKKNTFIHPSEIVWLSDQKLLINDAHRDTFFTVFDLAKGDIIKRIGAKGKGPYEMAYPSDLNLNPSTGNIEFMALNPSRLLGIKQEEILKNHVPLQPIISEFDFSVMKFCRIPQTNNFFASGMFPQKRFAVLNSKGKVVKCFGDYPEINGIPPQDGHLLGQAVQGFFASHPKKSKVVFASVFSEEISILNLENDSVTQLDWKGNLYPSVALRGESVAIKRESKSCFTGITVSEDYIFLLYSGGDALKGFDNWNYGKTLLVLDWELQPVASFKLDRGTNTISLGPKRKYIYGFSLVKNKVELIRFKLPEL